MKNTLTNISPKKLQKLRDQGAIIEEAPKRTNLQNKSLHMGCHLLAGELNSRGLDMRVVLKPDYKIRWDKDSIKENIIKPVAKSMYGVESTTKLTTAQISRVWEEIMQMLVDKFPTMDWVDFPSQEQTQSYLDSYETKKSL